MDADKLQQIQAHARAIAALLYGETEPMPSSLDLPRIHVECLF